MPGDSRLRRARIATLASLGGAVLTSLLFPSIGLLSEPEVRWIVLGAAGILALAGARRGRPMRRSRPGWRRQASVSCAASSRWRV